MSSPYSTSLGWLRIRGDRWIPVWVMAGLGCLSWIYVVHMTHPGLSPARFISAADTTPWSLSDLWAAFLMWTLMMVGMMLPSVVPWVWTLSAPSQGRENESAGSALAFLAGYLTVWTAYSLLAAMLQWLLHDLALIPWGKDFVSSAPAAVLLVVVGAYQWTPARLACLKHCRSPLAYFLRFWKPGLGGAYGMGWHHGLFCVGCCWALMLLSFVSGIMNLLWMVAVTAIVLLDHCLWERFWPGRVVGATLVAWGLWLLT